MDHLIRGDQLLAKKPGFKLVGRDEERLRLCSILMRASRNSTMLIGPGGVGSSSLCLGLEEMKTHKDAPFDIVSKRIFWLDIDELFSSGEQPVIAKLFRKTMDMLNRTPDSLLIISDTLGFIEACRNHNTMHFINSLMLSVKKGRTQVIFEVHDEGLDTVMKSHSDMREGYTLIDLSEPSGESLTEIVTAAAGALSKAHRIKVAAPAIQTAIELTNKYRTRDPGLSRAQPERSITLLDRALSHYRLAAHKAPPELAELKTRLAKSDPTNRGELLAEIERVQTEWDKTQAELRHFHDKQREAEIKLIALEDEEREQIAKEEKEREAGKSAAPADDAAAQERRSSLRMFTELSAESGYDSVELKAIRAKIEQFKKAVAENKQRFLDIGQKVDSKLELTRDMVMAEFSRISGISVAKLGEDQRIKLSRLEPEIKKRIFGQDHAVEQITNGIKVAKLGRRGKGEPLAYLLLGPSGVGKTEIAKAIAASVLDDEGALSRFDMSEYMEKHAVAKMIGAPPGYEGFEVGGILTNTMRKNPMRVLLFDEIEKAHPDVFNIFLQILSDGRLTDNVGRTVPFGDSIIIMTTNIGQPHFIAMEDDFEEAKKAALVELGQTYRSEFLNRFNGRQNIICFKTLDHGSMQKIVQREIANLDASYREQGIAAKITEEALVQFCADHYDAAIGARGLPGYIKSNLDPIIVNRLLDVPNYTGTLEIGYDREKKLFLPKFVEGNQV